MQPVIMPKLGLTMEEGTIIQWMKNEGESVEKGEILLEVETDKSINEVEASASGTLGKVFFDADDTMEVLTVIGYIIEPGEAPPDEWPEPVKIGGPAETKQTERAPEISIRISPIAKKIAKENGIDLAKVKGTGERGMITKEDVLRFAEGERTAEPQKGRKIIASPRAKRLAREKGISLDNVEGTGPRGRITEEDVQNIFQTQDLVELTRIQQITAKRMTESFTTVPHFYLRMEVDAGKMVEMRRNLLPYIEENTGERITFTDILVMLVARTLKRHPRVNASWGDGAIRLEKEVNISLAIAVEEGLIVPVIKNADQKGLEQIAAERKRLTENATSGKLGLSDLEGGTFTLTNLGMFEIDDFDAIINPPQSAVLAVGKIAERVLAENGQPVVKPAIRLSLSLDHRVLDGAVAARFLGDLKEMIEAPGEIFAESSKHPGG